MCSPPLRRVLHVWVSVSSSDDGRAPGNAAGKSCPHHHRFCGAMPMLVLAQFPWCCDVVAAGDEEVLLVDERSTDSPIAARGPRRRTLEFDEFGLNSTNLKKATACDEPRTAELYDQERKAKGTREPGTNRGTTRSGEATASTLADHGITKQQMSDWRSGYCPPPLRPPAAEHLGDLGEPGMQLGELEPIGRPGLGGVGRAGRERPIPGHRRPARWSRPSRKGASAAWLIEELRSRPPSGGRN
jgi:hypothetical protein